MRERPILFSAPMVRAILDGRKTQTRRAVKASRAFKGWDASPDDAYAVLNGTEGHASFLVAGDHGYTDWVPCPYGAPGDRLWVRETWCIAHPDSHDDPQAKDGRPRGVAADDGDPPFAYYRATDCSIVNVHDERRSPWRPSIFMPRWASRITLEIVSVRVERLHEISEKDAWAEGIDELDGHLDDALICAAAKQMPDCGHEDARATFAALWSEINGTESLAANPWVWVVEFRRVDAAAAATEAA